MSDDDFAESTYQESVIAVDDDGWILCLNRKMGTSFTIHASESTIPWLQSVYMKAVLTQKKADVQ